MGFFKGGRIRFHEKDVVKKNLSALVSVVCSLAGSRVGAHSDICILRHGHVRMCLYDFLDRGPWVGLLAHGHDPCIDAASSSFNSALERICAFATCLCCHWSGVRDRKNLEVLNTVCLWQPFTLIAQCLAPSFGWTQDGRNGGISASRDDEIPCAFSSKVSCNTRTTLPTMASILQRRMVRQIVHLWASLQHH